jgi:hypothetical protein
MNRWIRWSCGTTSSCIIFQRAKRVQSRRKRVASGVERRVVRHLVPVLKTTSDAIRWQWEDV